MRRIIHFAVFIFVLLSFKTAFSQTNVFPTTGNVGIGTATPTLKLDVQGAINFNTRLYNSNKLIFASAEGSATNGQNRMAAALYSVGRKLFPDDSFAFGRNSIGVYDNSVTNTVSASVITGPAGTPNKSGFVVEMKHAGSSQSPGFGGFYFANMTRANATFACIFKAKIPTGYTINFASNTIGTGGTSYWATDNVGTGKWEDYVYVVRCGDLGTFSTTNFFYITGAPAPSAGTPLIWHIASATVYDCDDKNGLTTTDVVASSRIVIGATTSTVPLHVKGNAGLLNLEGTNHCYIQFYPQLTTNGRKSYVGFNTTNSKDFVLANEFAGGSISIVNDGVKAMQVNSNGQIGLGTSTVPVDYRLAVAGNVLAEKVKVKKQSNGWPDYVFDSDYKLLSLEEIERFTKLNRHLPEIPSAREIERDGQDLGEMNGLLLKKVEELTLHLIEQYKEIKALKSKVESLQKHK